MQEIESQNRKEGKEVLNKVTLQGRLVADPELRHTQQGTPVASARIACDRDYKNQDGSKTADFINIVAWRGTGEFLSKFFSKGRMVVVDGRLQAREYTDRDGNRRYTTEVIAHNIYFGDSKRDGDSGGDSSPDVDYGSPTGGYGNGGFAELSDDDGELPF